MADQYLTISEAAKLKGVAPATIHDALCSGGLLVVLDFRAYPDECRFIRRWELEQWTPGAAEAGGASCPAWRRPRFTVLPAE